MNREDLRFKGVTRRWLLNIIGVVVIVVALIQIISSVLIYNYYYNSVRQVINSQIKMCASFEATYSSATDTEFEIAAKNFIDTYPSKNQLEVQIFDSKGNIIVTTKGFVPINQNNPDYNNAKQTNKKTVEFVGKNENGETIFSITNLMPEYQGSRVGALRFVVSLAAINRQIILNILMIIGIGLFVISITVFSGILFLRSILIPVKAINSAALRIANGNFEDRLPVKGDDEIGTLCQSINYMANELASTEQLKNDFISSVSHELRTPLTVIKGWGETVRSAIGVDENLTRKGINVMINESERLSGLVEDLLDFSRMQSGRLELKKEKIDILAELGEAVYMYESIAKKNNIMLEYVEPEILPPVMADPSRLKQVFINIIDNAIKYSQNGGHILVEASQHDIYIKVSVADMGCGIPASDLAKVKEKFYKANTTVRGSGIGLAIADEIIKQHNGVLMIDSKEGIGTTVSIALPFIKANDQERTQNEQ